MTTFPVRPILVLTVLNEYDNERSWYDINNSKMTFLNSKIAPKMFINLLQNILFCFIIINQTKISQLINLKEVDPHQAPYSPMLFVQIGFSKKIISQYATFI